MEESRKPSWWRVVENLVGGEFYKA